MAISCRFSDVFDMGGFDRTMVPHGVLVNGGPSTAGPPLKWFGKKKNRTQTSSVRYRIISLFYDCCTTPSPRASVYQFPHGAGS